MKIGKHRIQKPLSPDEFARVAAADLTTVLINQKRCFNPNHQPAPDVIERLAVAMPGHRYDHPAYPGDHDRCLRAAASITTALADQHLTLTLVPSDD